MPFRAHPIQCPIQHVWKMPANRPLYPRQGPRKSWCLADFFQILIFQVRWHESLRGTLRCSNSPSWRKEDLSVSHWTTCNSHLWNTYRDALEEFNRSAAQLKADLEVFRMFRQFEVFLSFGMNRWRSRRPPMIFRLPFIILLQNLLIVMQGIREVASDTSLMHSFHSFSVYI